MSAKVDPTTSTSTSTTSRDCWGAARERNRLKARKAIRQRILMGVAAAAAAAAESDDTNTGNNHAITQTTAKTAADQQHAAASQVVLSSSSSSPWLSHPVEKINRIRTILYRIVQGDRCFLSLQFLDENANLLTQPVPSECLLISQDAAGSTTTTTTTTPASPASLLLMQSKLASRFGHALVANLLTHCMVRFESFTCLEFAIWLGRYPMVQSLLLGGINPCQRGVLRLEARAPQTAAEAQNEEEPSEQDRLAPETQKAQREEEQDQQWRNELVTLGQSKVLQRFFQGRVPLSLSCYIVKRVVDMRLAAAKAVVALSASDNKNDDDGDVSSISCTLCHRIVPLNVSLYRQPCDHWFCEPCVWKDVLDHLDHRETGDVMPDCPKCCSSSFCCSDGATRNNDEMHERLGGNFSRETHRNQRRQASLEKFLALPADAKALKQRNHQKNKRKPKQPDGHFICSNWPDAVQHSLGSCQAVRRDKFFAHVEAGLYHHVHGCLEAGVDVTWTNEYGQTALFVAVWYRHSARLVHLLLDYGCDPCKATSHGGVTALAVARQQQQQQVHDSNNDDCRRDIVQMLLDYTNAGSNTTEQVSLEEEDDTIVESKKNERIKQSPLLEDSIDNQQPSPSPSQVVTTLIPTTMNHPGAGSFMIEQAISEHVATQLVDLWKTLPREESSHKKKNKSLPCSVRSYFCDARHFITKLLERVLHHHHHHHCVVSPEDEDDADGNDSICVFPHMRFLCYQTPGAVLAPHVDLCRTHPLTTSRKSTHSFLLYLSDCRVGGATSLLQDLTTGSVSGAGSGSSSGKNNNNAIALARVQPTRSRLLLFPHACPHEGEAVVDVPKLLIRGEVCLPSRFELVQGEEG